LRIGLAALEAPPDKVILEASTANSRERLPRRELEQEWLTSLAGAPGPTNEMINRTALKKGVESYFSRSRFLTVNGLLLARIQTLLQKSVEFGIALSPLCLQAAGYLSRLASFSHLVPATP
jgi:hypothetical protein